MKLEHKMENWKQYLNKKIKIIFDDGREFPSKKEGILKGYTDTHLFLEIDNNSQAILINKILRVEEMK